AGRSGRVPGVAPTPAAPDPFAAPDDEATPPRVFVGNGQARAVAVVDAGALGASCVEIVLARLDDPTIPIAVQRVSVPELRVDAVAAADPAIARDRVCPATGLF